MIAIIAAVTYKQHRFCPQTEVYGRTICSLSSTPSRTYLKQVSIYPFVNCWFLFGDSILETIPRAPIVFSVFQPSCTINLMFVMASMLTGFKHISFFPMGKMCRELYIGRVSLMGKGMKFDSCREVQFFFSSTSGSSLSRKYTHSNSNACTH